MLKIENEQIICFDVDETLILHNHKGLESLINPYSNTLIYFDQHIGHLELLKQMKGRGYYVRVWSAGGVKWAEAVVKKLGIEDHVDSVETKPLKYVDDLTTASDILGSRIYLKNEE